MRGAGLDGRDPFDVLREVARVSSATPDSAQDLVIRILDRREDFRGYEELVDALVAHVGLFPYLADEAPIGVGDQMAREFNRPRGLDDGVVFHRMQGEIYRRLLAGRSVVLSAPTSFGKSLIIDALVASGNYSNVVVVVPTIALIDETRRRLQRFRAQGFRVLTRSHQERGVKNLLVLTQERLLGIEELGEVDLFVIDEFYKLDPGPAEGADSERSILLNHALYRLLQTGAQCYLLGPNIDSVTHRSMRLLGADFVRTDYATVAADLHQHDPSDRVGTILDLCGQSRDPILVYCKSPASANRLAGALVERGLDDGGGVDTGAVSWLREEYHQEWTLAKALEKGVGLHHGRVPRAIAQWMVRAFDRGDFRILLCTSTLIEGVNTKARHVVVFDNERARRELDYFTFNNICGRSGRMSSHFVGHIHLFEAEPQADSYSVDIPVLSQHNPPDELIVHLDDADLSPSSRARIEELFNNGVLGAETLRRNRGVPPLQQIALAREILSDLNRYAPLLAWSGIPAHEEQMVVCGLIWDHFEFGGVPPVTNARSLCFWLAQLARTPEPRDLVRVRLEDPEWQDDPDAAVDEVLNFLRNWAGHRVPRAIRALDTIQSEVLASSGLPTGSYGHYADRIEHCFLPSALTLLEEYGLPAQLALRFRRHLRPESDLDEVLERLRRIDGTRLGLDGFELELWEDTRLHL